MKSAFLTFFAVLGVNPLNIPTTTTPALPDIPTHRCLDVARIKDSCECIPEVIPFLGEFRSLEETFPNHGGTLRQDLHRLLSRCTPWSDGIEGDFSQFNGNKDLVLYLAKLKLTQWSYLLWDRAGPWTFDFSEMDILHYVMLNHGRPGTLLMVQSFLRPQTWTNVQAAPLPGEEVEEGPLTVNVFWNSIVSTSMVLPVEEWTALEHWVFSILLRVPLAQTGRGVPGEFDGLRFGQPWLILRVLLEKNQPQLAWRLIQQGYSMSNCPLSVVQQCLALSERFQNQDLISFFREEMAYFSSENIN